MTVLTYLRHYKSPLFWEIGLGFDFEKYSRLACQADFFGVDALKNWIKNEKYKAVIDTRKYIETLEMEEATDGQMRDILPESKVLGTHWTVKKQYVCPRGLGAHYGQPNKCGRACRNAKGDDPDEYEDKEIMIVTVEREHVSFHLDRLTEATD